MKTKDGQTTSPQAREAAAERREILAAFLAPPTRLDNNRDAQRLADAWNAKHATGKPGYVIESKLTGRRKWYGQSPTGERT